MFDRFNKRNDIYIVVGIFAGLSLFSILNYSVFFITTIPSVLYMTKKGLYNPAKLIMMFLGTAFMVIKAGSLGPGSGMNLSMLIILFATFAFYSIEDYKYIFLSLTIVSISIYFLEVTNYSYFGIDTSTNKYEYEFNYVSTILFSILFFYVILRVNQYNNKKLIRLNFKLSNKNKKLGKINNELDSYVYKASHDMRAPLTSLMGILNLIKKEKDSNKIEALIELQENCITKLDNHIYQIINLSKNSKTGILPEKIELEEMINQIFEELSFFENAANTKKIITINQTAEFHSDVYRLKTIFNNLIANSFKYAKKGALNGEIEIDINITSNEANIIIKDNGIGIPEDQLGRIFEMFYRGTNLSNGSGLGLYMVKEILTTLGGDIKVNSTVGLTTTFYIIIPNAKA